MAQASKKLLDFVMLIGKLKSTKRTGWVNRGVSEPESVADHMYRMSVLSLLISPESGLNKDRCVKLSLVHDMAECIVGDITPADKVPKEEKHRQEKNAMMHITSLLSDETAQEIYSLWDEYEEQKSPEAQLVKDLDRFDMIMQAYEYEMSDERPGQLQEFFDGTKGQFRSPMVQNWVEELNKRRSDKESGVQETQPNAVV